VTSSAGNCEIVHTLLSKGAYIDALTTVGAALHFAAHNGRDDMVKILLDYHADVSMASPFLPARNF
jgi:ankyrin repeat protein